MNIPVLMYHSVSDDSQWLWGHMSCPVNVFEDHVRALVNAGFSTISLQELYDFTAQQTPLPPNPVALTFDDGYLDNWVYAFPVLKRYGCKGTIFVNPDFVDPRDIPRPTLDEVATGQVVTSSLQSKGFASWSELAVMDASGVVDVQSHTMTHTWYFNDDHIVDFHHPGDRYPWLAWNTRPERKYLWLNEDQSGFVPLGAPVYAYQRAMVARRYMPDPRLAELLAEMVQHRGGQAFFQEPAWREALQKWVRDYGAQCETAGCRESDTEYQTRIQHELGASKEVIEARLRKKVNFVCWPGGEYNDATERVARQAGYLSMVYAPGGAPQPRQDSAHTPRLGAPTLTDSKARTRYRSGRYLVYMLRCKQGAILGCLGCKLLSGREMVWLRIQQAIEPVKKIMHAES